MLPPRARAALCLAALALVGCDDREPPARTELHSILGGEAVIGVNDGFARAERLAEFAFPRDHGPHPRFRSEWWYVTFVLATRQGREFGAQFTLFRQAVAAPSPQSGRSLWRSGQVYLGHVAVSDVAERRHYAAERIARGHPALAGVEQRAASFAAHIEGWRLASADAGELWPWRLEASTREFALDLALAPTKPVVLNGDRGLSRKGPDNASYYYSVPRMSATGALSVGGERHRVAGAAWLDREWSTSVLAADYAGWDWFALHFDDGVDLMLYQLRRHDGSSDEYAFATLIDADGTSRGVPHGDFSLVVVERWQGWPVAWQLDLPALAAAPLRVAAVFEDQVMDTSVRYWEGLVDVADRNGRRLGRGYMELTGYADGRSGLAQGSL